MDKLKVSIGICAYNEEANIGRLLDALVSQKTSDIEITQIVVVSSACKDATDDIVEAREKTDSSGRIHLIKQAARRGKASAINLFLQVATGDICVLESADTVPFEDTIEQLCAPYSDQKVGMTGGRPMPVDDPRTFLGFVTHFIWKLHHKIASVEPKLGELVAFRNVVKVIPENTAVDEACIEQIIRDSGYEIRYVPMAYVQNKGPATVRDFLKQRRRIYTGHLHLRKNTKYQVSTMKPFRVLKLSLQDMERTWKGVTWTLGAIILEAYARFLGSYDFYIKKRNPYVWDIAASTKDLSLGDDRNTATDSPV